MGIYKPTEMTSNSLPSPFTVSASAYHSAGFEAFKAFDGLADTYWASPAGGHLNTWLKIDMGSDVLITGYHLRSFTAGSFEPTAWTLEGSTDDSTYVTLDNQTGISWAAGETKTFSFSNQDYYRYYKLTMTAISGGDIMVVSAFSVFVRNNIWYELPAIGSSPTLETDIRATLEQWRQNMEDLSDEWASSSVSGDVSGPATNTDNAIARYDGADSKTIQNSLVTIDDSGAINIPSGQTYKINGSAHTHTEYATSADMIALAIALGG